MLGLLCPTSLSPGCFRRGRAGWVSGARNARAHADKTDHRPLSKLYPTNFPRRNSRSREAGRGLRGTACSSWLGSSCRYSTIDRQVTVETGLMRLC